MKKVLSIAVLLFFTVNLYAQLAPTPYYGFKLGLTAHPTFGFIKAENGKGNGISLGFSYGLMGDFNFAENYSFSTAVTITTINGKSTELNVPQYEPTISRTKEYEIKYKMQYIEIPLTIKLKTSEIGAVKWYGQFGLSNDFNISSKQDATSEGIELANDKNSSDWTRFYRAGMIIGGGLEYRLDGKTSLMMGLTYNNGFTNITTGANNIRNHYVGLNVGVFF